MQNSLKNIWEIINRPFRIMNPKYLDLMSFVTISGLVLLSFGPFFDKLGYYIDDWKFLFWEFNNANLHEWMVLGAFDSRPFSGMYFYYAFKLLGRDPINWHILSSIGKILTSFTFYMLFVTIFKGKRKNSLIIASLFAVIPLFKIQSSALTYSIHWLSYFFYALSLLLLVCFIRRKNYLYLILSLIATVIHLPEEYFLGLEIIRPLIIYYLVEGETKKDKLKKTAAYWAPYFIPYSAFVYYRWSWVLSYYSLPEYSELHFLKSLAKNPVSTLLTYGEYIIQDLIYALLSFWGDVFSYDHFEITRIGKVKSLLIAFIGGIGSYLIFTRFPENGLLHKEKQQYSFLFKIALLAIFGGLVTGWMINQSVTHGNLLTDTRFLLSSTLGFCILYFLFVDTFIRSTIVKNGIFAIIIFFSIAFQLNLANQFRWSWEQQKDLFQQLSWRAPQIEPDTMILSARVLVPLVGEPFDSYALKSMYYPQSSGTNFPLWFASLGSHFPSRKEQKDLLEGIPIDINRRYQIFHGNSQDMIIVDFQPARGRCLWILNTYDRFNPHIGEDLRDFAAFTDFNRILSEPTSSTHDFLRIFDENQDHWCYYYEKADLASQNMDWQTVISLWNQAKQNGHSPDNGLEYRPFVQAFAYSGNWEKAKDLTIQGTKMLGKRKDYNHYYCTVWGDIAKDTGIETDVIEEIINRLDCEDF